MSGNPDEETAEQAAAPHPRLELSPSANSAYTLSPSKRGEGKFVFNFDALRKDWRLGRLLPAPLRGEGRGQHGDQPGRPRVRGSSWLRATLVTFAGVLLVTFTAAGIAMHTVEPAPIAAAEAMSVTVLDRQDRLLRAFTTSGGRWRLPIEPGEVDARYLRLLTAFEDRRFYSHGGVDPRGLTRAALQFVRHGRIISGGSTLTMQVARLLVGEHERTGSGKLRQIVRAWQLERTLSKQEILRLYLRMAPFGGNIEGVRAASLTYFGREPRRLSVGEAALLVALPQAPEVRRPDRFPEAAKKARARVLAQGVKQGVITAAEAARANAERMPTMRQDFPKYAPHLAEAEMAASSETSVHRLTLDRDLQGQLEVLVREQTRALGNRLSAAILVADHKTGEVLAHVGSSDYFDETRFGSVDMVRAVRSPGSTLKPFIYGLAFEAGIAHPETLIEDRPVRFGTYTPKNFDEDFHGTVSIREALAQSLNIPAVKVLNAVGPGKLLGRFRRAGILATLPKDSHEPTLAIALGGVGLRLADLAGLYAGLARGGDVIELRHQRGQAPKPVVLRRQLMTPVAASFVTDILKDAPPPVAAKGGRIAYKTGTSYGYRDAWAVGYDGQHVIAVWVGRPDSTATPGLTGRTAAAPLLFDAFHRLSAERVALAQATGARVSGAALPPPLKRFQEPGETNAGLVGPYLDANVQIAFPPDRAELELEDAGDTIQLKADGGVLPLTWLADDTPLQVDGQQRQIQWTPPGRGFVKLSVIDAKGQVDRVTVRVR
jgi:penicillin-binding protein 1C